VKVSEKQIQDAIVAWLEAEGYVVWRCSLGGVLVRNKGGRVFAKNPMKGYPDLGTTHRKHRGRLVAIEVKTPDGVISPEQHAWHAKLRAEGALVIVATSVEDVRKALTPQNHPGEATG